jgi:hypothetical protein
MSYPITDIGGIDGDVAMALKSAGIRSTMKLLEEARMRIKGISKEYAELLQAAGVNTVKELRYRSPVNLARAMADANKRHKLVRLLPSEKVVCRWIEQAQMLELKIKY